MSVTSKRDRNPPPEILDEEDNEDGRNQAGVAKDATRGQEVRGEDVKRKVNADGCSPDPDDEGDTIGSGRPRNESVQVDKLNVRSRSGTGTGLLAMSRKHTRGASGEVDVTGGSGPGAMRADQTDVAGNTTTEIKRALPPPQRSPAAKAIAQRYASGNWNELVQPLRCYAKRGEGRTVTLRLKLEPRDMNAELFSYEIATSLGIDSKRVLVSTFARERPGEPLGQRSAPLSKRTSRAPSAQPSTANSPKAIGL